MAKEKQKNKVAWFIINKVKEIRTKKGFYHEDLTAHLNISAAYMPDKTPNFRVKL